MLESSQDPDGPRSALLPSDPAPSRPSLPRCDAVAFQDKRREFKLRLEFGAKFFQLPSEMVGVFQSPRRQSHGDISFADQSEADHVR